MTKQDLETAITILKSTLAFKLGQIRYEEYNGRLKIFSTNSSDTFHATEIIHLFSMFSTFLSYDKKIEKVYLRIY